jgi:hypothetical protein
MGSHKNARLTPKGREWQLRPMTQRCSACSSTQWLQQSSVRPRRPDEFRDHDCGLPQSKSGPDQSGLFYSVIREMVYFPA